MKKYLNPLLIAVIGLGVIAGAVFAARIPPLWSGFTFSSLLILLASVLLRLNSKKERKGSATEGNPLNRFSSLLEKLLAELDDFLVSSKEDNVWVDRLEDSLEHFYVALEDIRPSLLEAMGMKKYAGLASIFARAERLLNRGLSSGIDGYPGEAAESLRQASEIIRNTLNELGNSESAVNTNK